MKLPVRQWILASLAVRYTVAYQAGIRGRQVPMMLLHWYEVLYTSTSSHQPVCAAARPSRDRAYA